MAQPKLAPEQQKKIFSGLCAVIGVVVWFNFFFAPQWRRWSQGRPEVGRLRQEATRIREGIGQIPVMEAELSSLTEQYKLPAVSQPPEEQLPQLLEEIAKMAHAAQVRVVAVKLKKDLGVLTPGPSGYLELPMQLEVAAGYHQLGAFVDALERSERLVRIQEFGISGDSQDLWRHPAVFILQAYLVPGPHKGNG